MINMELPQAIVPNPSWRNKLAGLSGQNSFACYQCEKCTNGCPATFAMDIVPHKLMRGIHLGLKEEILRSNTIWACTSCRTCTTRCPNGIDIAHIMDTLKQISLLEGIKPAQKDVPIFHSAVLSSIKRHGRIHELEMITNYTLRSEGLRGLQRQSGRAIKMFTKGKIKLLPYPIRPSKQVRNIFRQTEMIAVQPLKREQPVGLQGQASKRIRILMKGYIRLLSFSLRATRQVTNIFR